MAEEAQMKVRLRVQLHNGAFVDCDKIELVDIDGEPRRLMLDGGPAAVHWEDTGGIAVVRVPVIERRTSIAPMGG